MVMARGVLQRVVVVPIDDEKDEDEPQPRGGLVRAKSCLLVWWRFKVNVLCVSRPARTATLISKCS